MRSRYLWLAASAVIHLPLSLGAQGENGPLTLGVVYDAMVTRSPRVAAASATAEAARARVGPVSRWPDPTIQLALMNRSLPGLERRYPLGMNQIQVMQMVPLGGRTGLAARAARAEARAEGETARETVNEARVRAAMVFYDLYGAGRAVAVMLESRRLLVDVLRAAEAMYAQGRGAQADVLRAQVELARMEEELVRMGAMADAMRARLQALTGLGADTTQTLLLPRLPADLPPREELEQAALANRPMLAAGTARVRAAEAEAVRAGREIWPDLTLGAAYGQGLMADGSPDRMLSLMVGFSLPLSPGRRQGQMAAEARAMRAMRQADLEEMQTETLALVGERRAEAARSISLIALYHSTLLPQLAALATSARAGYRNGTAPFMALLDAEMDANRARQELGWLEAGAGKALAELEMLTATTLVDPRSTADSGGSR